MRVIFGKVLLILCVFKWYVNCLYRHIFLEYSSNIKLHSFSDTAFIKGYSLACGLLQAALSWDIYGDMCGRKLIFHTWVAESNNSTNSRPN